MRFRMYLSPAKIGKNPRDTFDHQVVILNIKKAKKKQQFLVGLPETQYFFLSDLEYKFGYYVLMNRWQVPVIQKWIAEYHEKVISNPNGQKTTFFFI